MASQIVSVGFMLLVLNSSGGVFIVTKEEEPNESRWAVLVAGSNYWSNYRHQADICHAYQILHADGIPDSNIIVMMFDDIAYYRGNPLPGTIINRPDGPNVYKGVVKDYTGKDVTPENFLNVLRGNESAMAGIGSGKVLSSDSNDRVFINLVDHGAPGIFAFPDSYLLARVFVDTLISLHRNKRFKSMVIYVESCESGSMFSELLPDNINVYAVTASSPTQPSYACYLDSYLNAYVGDLFSVRWMENTDSEGTDEETFDTQFQIVFNETENVETPSRYGDLSIEYELLSNFLGHSNDTKDNQTAASSADVDLDKLKTKKVKSFDVSWHLLEHKLQKATSREESHFYQMELIRLHKNRKFVADKVEEIVLRVTWSSDLTKSLMDISQAPEIANWNCYELAVTSFHSKCFNLGKNPYALRFVGILSKLCDHNYSAEEIEESINEVCGFPSVVNIL